MAVQSTPNWHVVTFVMVALLATVIAVAGKSPVQAVAGVALVQLLVQLLRPGRGDDGPPLRELPVEDSDAVDG